jgi:segregation and condensation protein B
MSPDDDLDDAQESADEGRPAESGGEGGARFDIPPMAEQERMIEAILFAASAPMTVPQIAARMPEGCDPAEAIQNLRRRFEGRGVLLNRAGEGWAFRTAPDLGFLMRKEAVEMKKLSRAGLETLAIIAYHQPVTRGEIEEIRGVSLSRGTLDALMEMGWIKLGRRRLTPGRPATFVTTAAFLDHFGLESARDLPGLKELRDAGLLDNAPLPEGLSSTEKFEDQVAEEDEKDEDLFE